MHTKRDKMFQLPKQQVQNVVQTSPNEELINNRKK
jgi:hypothetical protein